MWPCSTRRGSAVARLLCLRVRISNPQGGSWMFVSCECFVLSGTGLCDGLITRPEDSYRVCGCVWVWSSSFDNADTLVHWGLLRHGERTGSIMACLIWLATVLFSVSMKVLFQGNLRRRSVKGSQSSTAGWLTYTALSSGFVYLFLTVHFQIISWNSTRESQ